MWRDIAGRPLRGAPISWGQTATSARTTLRLLTKEIGAAAQRPPRNVLPHS